MKIKVAVQVHVSNIVLFVNLGVYASVFLYRDVCISGPRDYFKMIL